MRTIGRIGGSQLWVATSSTHCSTASNPRRRDPAHRARIVDTKEHDAAFGVRERDQLPGKLLGVGGDDASIPEAHLLELGAAVFSGPGVGPGSDLCSRTSFHSSAKDGQPSRLVRAAGSVSAPRVMAICSIIPAPCASASRPSAGLFHAGRLAARHRRPSLSLGRRPSRPHRSAAVLPSHLRARHKRSQDAPFPGRPHPWVEGVLDARRGLGAVGDGDHRRRRLEPRGGPSPGGLAPVVSEQVVAVEHQIGKRLPGPGPAVQIVLDLRVVVDVVEAGFPGAGVGQGVVPDDHPRRLDEAGLDGVVQAEVAETPGSRTPPGRSSTGAGAG